MTYYHFCKNKCQTKLYPGQSWVDDLNTTTITTTSRCRSRRRFHIHFHSFVFLLFVCCLLFDNSLNFDIVLLAFVHILLPFILNRIQHSIKTAQNITIVTNSGSFSSIFSSFFLQQKLAYSKSSYVQYVNYFTIKSFVDSFWLSVAFSMLLWS